MYNTNGSCSSCIETCESVGGDVASVMISDNDFATIIGAIIAVA